MNLPKSSARVPDFSVDAQFTQRWSPRSLKSDALSPDQVMTLLEAVRWSPSSMNSQPWRVVYATRDAQRARLVEALVPGNQSWAQQAPLLLFLASARFDDKGRPLTAATFDCGAAWMSLALQARKLDLFAHALGGFDAERAYQVTGLDPARFTIHIAIAVGARDQAEKLSPELQAREAPNQRRPVNAWACEGQWQDA